MDNIAVFQKPHPPLLIVHGKRDNVLSFHNSEDLYKEAVEPKSLLLLPDGGHVAFGKQFEFHTATTAFLKKNNLE